MKQSTTFETSLECGERKLRLEIKSQQRYGKDDLGDEQSFYWGYNEEKKIEHFRR